MKTVFRIIMLEKRTTLNNLLHNSCVIKGQLYQNRS